MRLLAPYFDRIKSPGQLLYIWYKNFDIGLLPWIQEDIIIHETDLVL